MVFVFSDLLMSKSATVSITFEVGEVTFVELPGFFEPGSTINGKASKSSSFVTEAFTLVMFPKLSFPTDICDSFQWDPNGE